MLRTEGLSVYYGRVQAVREVSLSVAEGEIVALVGANGAGKTSLLNAVCGQQPLRAGKVWLNGRAITGVPSHRSVRMGLGYVPEGRQIFGDMSVMDNLTLGSYIECGRSLMRTCGPVGWFLGRADLQSRLDDVFDLFPVLRERQRQRSATLSGGEQQMLAIGRALMSSPRMLVLDEPSIGLAPTLVREIFSLLRRLREQGLTVLLVEQDAVAALKIADRGYVMERGRIVIEGPARDLLGDEKVRHAYLGKTRLEVG